MTARLLSLLSVGLVASASIVATLPASDAQAQKKKAPAKKPTKAKGPLAPAKDGAPAAGAAAGTATGTATTTNASGSAAAGAPEGSSVQMAEDPPPADINGVDENPDAPRAINDPDAPKPQVEAPKPRPTGYPIEEVLRPITLPQNLSEVSVGPHAQVSPYAGAMALRARYGITSKVQLGLTYMLGGIYDDPETVESKQAFHPGKAVGLDVTVMLQDWIGVQVGVPVYLSPVAVSLTLGAPIKFNLLDKVAIGGLDDLLNIKLHKFAPTFYQELQNAKGANDTNINTIKSDGELRFSFYGLYQYESNFAIVARAGIQMEDFATGKTNGCDGECLTTFIRAGFDYTPRRYLDLGLSLGFDDLAHGGSFAPAGYLAFRI